ncbi:MAG TPA: alpha-amylase family glycosyl hydrolase [Acidisarcina sp.]
MMEFHISRDARDRYRFDETLSSLTGNVVFASLSASREFAHRMNQVREAASPPEQTVLAAALYTMGLIDEATHAVMASYRKQFDPAVMTDALRWFADKVGGENLDKLLLRFVEYFPGVEVYRGNLTPAQWLAGATDGAPNRAAALEEMMLLWMANHNLAFQPFQELFEDSDLAEKTAYAQVTASLPAYFATRPRVEVNAADLIAGDDASANDDSGLAAGSSVKRARAVQDAAPDAKVPVTIFELLRAPALAAPESLPRQLARIRRAWKPLLAPGLQHGLTVAAEILQEEERAVWMRFHPEGGAGDDHGGHEAGWGNVSEWISGRAGGSGSVSAESQPPPEYEKFSPDVAWMPTAVLLAKSTYVWLAQLTRQYGRSITRLDQIPDEELDVLARRGMNSLWLIGVWERSRASQTIKQLCGNADAVASAYSLYDYQIAADLGGESAYISLRDRCYRRGIRLASDMVANHMGIDSPWVVEHPDWFLSRHDLPYPAYNFDGPDLSPDPRVEIKIEKHYYEQTDAAVVFRRIDRQSGEMRYIYHGNDGTSFPWNDTAQLDYMNPAVREQVIQTILRVARMFPVIRFDAAMTLAKRHFHRLWFPGPGASGAIPSRAEYSMSDEEFNRVMPNEFWREVVDRVAAEVPGTLLLAEAFWLMESYFVRTLGMHRVYNSAFMVMLRDEDNANYRSVLKKTLEFDPDIMKRYVNFMSNPDERTAIDQFGNGDKCFGVAALMATLPGLPMFGHGQVEGYTEKYGMEYRRPRFNESPDPWLVDRHQRQIAPLLHQRWLFAESSNFRLYDFVRDDGAVEENVFAYSNRSGDARAVVLYNNSYSSAHGRIDLSAAYADKGSGQQRRQRLGDTLGFSDDSAAILAWRDSLTGLQYLRRASEVAERGLGMHLQGYQCHVLLDWRELRATAEKKWDQLCDQLNGHGIPDLENGLVHLELRPAHEALRALLDPGLIHELARIGAASGAETRPHPPGAELQISHPAKNDENGNVGESPLKAEDASISAGVLPMEEWFSKAWQRCGPFLAESSAAYALIAGEREESAASPVPESEWREVLHAAIALPSLKAEFPAPWLIEAATTQSAGAPKNGTAIWAAIFFLAALNGLAKSINPVNWEAAALSLYDTLRLREPLAHALAALGLEGEESWRLAGVVRVLLLAESGGPEQASAISETGEEFEDELVDNSMVEPLEGATRVSHEAVEGASVEANPAAAADADLLRLAPVADDPADQAPAGFTAHRGTGTLEMDLPLDDFDSQQLTIRSPALWVDADVRWLTVLHEAEGISYFQKEGFEELAWWLPLPALLGAATNRGADPGVISSCRSDVEEALEAAALVGYRLDPFLAGLGSASPDHEVPQTTGTSLVSGEFGS